MSNVVPLFPDDFVSLEQGLTGPLDNPSVFLWLVWHEPDGMLTNVWDGDNYEKALEAAAYWQQNGIRFVDNYSPESIGGDA